jgi:Protein of unknown function (DUF3592)
MAPVVRSSLRRKCRSKLRLSSVSFESVWPRVLAVVFMLGGVFLVVLGGHLALEEKQFLASAAVADGVVVEVVAHEEAVTAPKRSTTWVVFYYPVVHFVAKDGQDMQFEADQGADKPEYDVGDSVRVLYDPTNPNAAQLQTWSSTWAVPIISTLVGLCVGALGVLVFVRFPSETRETPERQAIVYKRIMDRSRRIQH